LSNLPSNIFSKYGIKSIIIAIVLAIVIWFIAHISAAPGTEVSILWGLVRYTKPIDDNKSGLTTERENNPIEKNEETKSSDKDSSFSPISIFIKYNLTKNKLEKFLTKIRAENKVRELKTMETGKEAFELPDGIYSFISALLFDSGFYRSISLSLPNKPLPFYRFIRLTLLHERLSRYRRQDSDFEIHFIDKQNILVLGFTTEKDAAEISYLNGVDKHSIIMSPAIFGEFSSLVVIPANRIIDSNSRSIDVSKDEWYTVLDLVLK